MNSNNYRLKDSVHSDELHDQSESTCCRRNWCRLLVIATLTLLAMGSTSSLIIILYKDALKEKLLAEKKKGWVKKWQKVEPYVKHFPLGFILGFIRNLIVLAIERQFEV